ncbi:MAG: metallophosphoesterase, partial [Candidatus Woesearchaeota archaeon]
MNSQEIINFYLENNILISPDMLSELDDRPLPILNKFIVLNKDTIKVSDKNPNLDIENFEKAIVLKEKHKSTKLYEKFIEALTSREEKFEKRDLEKSINIAMQANASILQTEESSPLEKNTGTPKYTMPKDDKDSKDIFMEQSKIRIVSSYNSRTRKWSVYDFVNLYVARFKEIEKILRSRQELQNLTSISRITSKRERENIALIGMVYEKATTKSGNIILTIEDPTGMVKAVINKNKEELFRLAEEIQLDEMIGITGMFDQIIFVNNVLLPDIPLTRELKKSPTEGYFVVIADTEPGSKLFLEKEFNKFLSWLNGEVGNERQREVASKVKYLFIGGDLVNGVGIYPNQEYDLNIIDIRDQYKKLAELLDMVPKHIAIIICPGNHDVGRISEPQPALTKEYAESLISLPNLISVSNPSMINIYAQPESGFGGFDILFYHGNSFVYYSENVPAIRRLGGQKRPDLIMKYLLQRRHLAPTHTSTLYIPDPKKDPLVIDKIPD